MRGAAPLSPSAAARGRRPPPSRRVRGRARPAFWDADGEGSAHETLLEDASVDAVYIALPHALHAEWVGRALSAGKAVLCEKPLALDEDEAGRLTAISRREGVLLMEGMKTRFTPAYRRVRELVLAGENRRGRTRRATLCNDMLAQFEAGMTYISHPGGGWRAARLWHVLRLLAR